MFPKWIKRIYVYYIHICSGCVLLSYYDRNLSHQYLKGKKSWKLLKAGWMLSCYIQVPDSWHWSLSLLLSRMTLSHWRHYWARLALRLASPFCRYCICLNWWYRESSTIENSSVFSIVRMCCQQGHVFSKTCCNKIPQFLTAGCCLTQTELDPCIMAMKGCVSRVHVFV